MKNIFLFILFIPLISLAQVGVNTTTPKAALDVDSSNNGVLIPRVQLFDVFDNFTVVNPNAGPLETSTLIYNIAPAGVIPNNVVAGFYYWNGIIWVPIAGNTTSDHDWYEEGTTTAPNAITDDMFHTGNVAIGKNSADYTLDVETTTNSIGFKNLISSNFQKTGITSNLLHSIGNQNQIGIESTINSTVSSGSSPFIYSFKSSLIDSGQGENYGFHNTINNSNPFANNYGIKNNITSLGYTVGVENIITTSGGGAIEATGTRNNVFGTSDTTVYGTRNTINQTGANGSRYGTFNDLTTSSGTDLYGSYSTLNSGNTNRYGSYNVINNGIGFGSNYGVYSRVLTSGFENYAGYFLGDVAIGRTDLNKYILPQTRGTNGQIMQTDGFGIVTWQNPNTNAWSLNGNTAITTPISPANYGTSTITATENFIGTTDANDFTIGTNNIERMRVKNTTGNVGIGTANPTEIFNVYKNSDENKSVIFGEARQISTSGDYLNIGVKGLANGNGDWGFGVGVLGMSDINNTWNSTGVYAQLGTTNPTFSSFSSNNQALIANGNGIGRAAMFLGGNVGVGLPLTTNPSTLLHINSPTNGAVRIVDGTEGNGKVLTSNATGVGTWQPVGIENIQANLAAVTGITISYTDTANFLQTGASITLPPGRYAVNVTMLLSTVPGAYTNSNEAFWVRSSFSDSPGPLPLQSGDIIGSNLVSGNLVPSTLYSLLTGMVVINNTTLANKTYYYVAGRVVTNNSTRSIAFFGGNYLAENNIIAYRLN